MPPTLLNQPHHPGRNDPDDEPDTLPVEPDEGPVPAEIPEDPEQHRVVLPTRLPRNVFYPGGHGTLPDPAEKLGFAVARVD